MAGVFNQVGTFTVVGRIKDKDGVFTDYTVTIRVQYPQPMATFTGGPVTEGSARAVTFSAAGAGLAPFTYSYDYDNNGTFEVTNSSSATATVPASFLDDGPGSRTVRPGGSARGFSCAMRTRALPVRGGGPGDPRRSPDRRGSGIRKSPGKHGAFRTTGQATEDDARRCARPPRTPGGRHAVPPAVRRSRAARRDHCLTSLPA